MARKKNLWVVLLKNLLTKKTSTRYAEGDTMFKARENAQKELDETEEGGNYTILSVLQR